MKTKISHVVAIAIAGVALSVLPVSATFAANNGTMHGKGHKKAMNHSHSVHKSSSKKSRKSSMTSASSKTTEAKQSSEAVAK